ncbi:hypothetical protein I4F81_011644 [Pyropia yezoensis]|uniref:Uncharacterized protein n=1 Tax=Pyropia yezoensis TaxID=2788 RepID=A0ACC3CH76_PYRYE|nr:hypothetical protein I4F81_011644 [Neopyropia yezoensis]
MWRSTLRVPGPFWLGIRTAARLTLYPASSPSCCTSALSVPVVARARRTLSNLGHLLVAICTHSWIRFCALLV